MLREGVVPQQVHDYLHAFACATQLTRPSFYGLCRVTLFPTAGGCPSLDSSVVCYLLDLETYVYRGSGRGDYGDRSGHRSGGLPCGNLCPVPGHGLGLDLDLDLGHGDDAVTCR